MLGSSSLVPVKGNSFLDHVSRFKLNGIARVKREKVAYLGSGNVSEKAN